MRQTFSDSPKIRPRLLQYNFNRAIRKSPKNIPPIFISLFSQFELNGKTFISFSLLCACCVRRRAWSDRGGTRRWAVPRVSVRGPVPRPQTWRTVPRSGLPGRLCEWQVQSHPLITYLTQFYKHKLFACFTKLHMLWLLKTWLDSHPFICYNHSLTT